MKPPRNQMEIPMRHPLILPHGQPGPCRAVAELAGAGRPTAPVQEVARFRLRPGSDQAAFLAAARATAAPLRRQRGFLRRALLRNEDGIWTDQVEWVDRPSADRAATAIMAEPACQPFMARIDMESLTMDHPVLLWRMD
jgi:hypothetical protein